MRKAAPRSGELTRVTGCPASLFIDETRNVRVQPFLLIVRTGWIFTAHARPYVEGETRTSTTRYSEFPANSRIYRQRGIHCLATF
jgi:hypothetical protein